MYVCMSLAFSLSLSVTTMSQPTQWSPFNQRSLPLSPSDPELNTSSMHFSESQQSVNKSEQKQKGKHQTEFKHSIHYWGQSISCTCTA